MLDTRHRQPRGRPMTTGELLGSRSDRDTTTGALVLLVEDDEAIRDMFQLMLLAAGYRVIACSDGRAALMRLGFIDPAVIVTDLRMPHVDGLDLAREVRRRGLAVPLVLVTAYPLEDERVVEFGRLSQTSVLTKDHPEQLTAAIETWLREPA